MGRVSTAQRKLFSVEFITLYSPEREKATVLHELIYHSNTNELRKIMHTAFLENACEHQTTITNSALEAIDQHCRSEYQLTRESNESCERAFASTRWKALNHDHARGMQTRRTDMEKNFLRKQTLIRR